MIDLEVPDYKQLEIELGYHFEDPDLLKAALKSKQRFNETLQSKFGREELDPQKALSLLGDGLLKSILVAMVIERGEKNTGNVDHLRQEEENNNTLTLIGKKIELWKYLDVNDDERNRMSNIGIDQYEPFAMAIEALIAAVYLDRTPSNYENCKNFVEKLYVRLDLIKKKEDNKTFIQCINELANRTQPNS